MRFVHPRRDEKANMVLVEAVKGGGVELKVEPPLFVYRGEKEYTDEVRLLFR
jgi:tRNA1Val (adenine37-N6)-methyltransferase